MGVDLAFLRARRGLVHLWKSRGLRPDRFGPSQDPRKTPMEPPKAHFGVAGGGQNPPKTAQEPPRATSNSQSRHAQNHGNMCIWPPGISKKRSRAIFRRSETPPENLESEHPYHQGRSWVPKRPPGSAQGAPEDTQGPPGSTLVNFNLVPFSSIIDHYLILHKFPLIFYNFRLQ